MRSSARVAAPLAALLLAGCAGAASGTGPRGMTAGTTVSPAASASASASSVMAAPAVTPSGEPEPTPVPTAADPATLQGVRPCRASDVRVALEHDGATGVSITAVRLVARAGVTCRLGGWPRAGIVARGGTVPTVRERRIFAPDWKGPFVVRPGHAGYVELTWRATRWCAPPVRDLRVEIRMPGGASSPHPPSAAARSATRDRSRARR